MAEQTRELASSILWPWSLKNADRLSSLPPHI
ncbi:hypothetical protein SNOG_08124 [Parastagonospora nodorum SN15]|uniref:Uncharacterized protein n=1 Tax=Phaeosphaeria nodorum (strain SN15 / ATCC MYA-4574 / FGSC 10173) TaxID=321614 RepID=Q0UJE0_PHANO|nr:hypothetical protein SNOG_08124 [Parastagonospora nodorum SN15]EAT84400.1 hypothetical protein SNOG_08124 [Parastagonospora nodorum SN15]